MMKPISTYRIQFHENFCFGDLLKIIPYLKKLGIGTLYASPVFTSVPGSIHGYDGVDPHRIDPEIGNEEQLISISAQLKSAGIKWLQDIVPNHMAYHQANPWMMDVLEKGRHSQYSGFFDIDWYHPSGPGRVMAPVLGGDVAEIINKGDLKIAFEHNQLVLKYFENYFPLNAAAYNKILQAHIAVAGEPVKKQIESLLLLEDMSEAVLYSSKFEAVKLQLVSNMQDTATQNYLAGCLDEINKSPEAIAEIAAMQFYRLCSWQETDTQINYRRFFTINGLICLNIQDDAVFNYYHKYIKTLVEDGVFDGLRVDHIDGLFEPLTYLQRLRALAGDDTYIAVEKILEPGEEMPHWPIQGNTGYDFLSLVNNLFTDRGSEAVFTAFYEKISKQAPPIQQQIRNKKRLILNNHMGGELENLYSIFSKTDLSEYCAAKDIDPDKMKEAIGAFLVACPVYRYYAHKMPLEPAEANAVKDMLSSIEGFHTEKAMLSYALLEKPLKGDTEYNKAILYFYMRCMQFTGPLMAKGVEDTLMYTNTRFIGHNDVGDSLDAFGTRKRDFHSEMENRLAKWPLSINATATHDTKRGEDARARLNVLTDLPGEWFQLVYNWQQANVALKTDNAPDANDEYFIYQSIAGTYPMPGQDTENYNNRVLEYITKALREAKRHTSWTAPDEQYEEGTKNFINALLDDNSVFMSTFKGFHAKISAFGIVNSLAQVLLKFACPGVPDVYQGCETWDLSMVDPDNRRPVDYNQNQIALAEIECAIQNDVFLNALWQDKYSAKIKLWLTHILFNERKANSEVFTAGTYTPLYATGIHSKNIFAFARSHKGVCYVVVIPLHIAALCHEQGCEITDINWKDTLITLPADAAGKFINITGLSDGYDDTVSINDLFCHIPIALLKNGTAN